MLFFPDKIAYHGLFLARDLTKIVKISYYPFIMLKIIEYGT